MRATLRETGKGRAIEEYDPHQPQLPSARELSSSTRSGSIVKGDRSSSPTRHFSCLEMTSNAEDDSDLIDFVDEEPHTYNFDTESMEGGSASGEDDEEGIAKEADDYLYNEDGDELVDTDEQFEKALESAASADVKFNDDLFGEIDDYRPGPGERSISNSPVRGSGDAIYGSAFSEWPDSPNVPLLLAKKVTEERRASGSATEVGVDTLSRTKAELSKEHSEPSEHLMSGALLDSPPSTGRTTKVFSGEKTSASISSCSIAE